tara:strand:+ start:348 stop:629 length:282 start_codon:yes stop_codon:yes gene_type:complete
MKKNIDELEYHQLSNGTSEKIVTLIFEMIDRAYEDGQRIDIQDLTREIFGMGDEFIPNLVSTPEFNAVCSGVDFLIEEDSVWFDTRDGTVHRT